MISVLEYLASNGVSPFRKWFDRLDPSSASKIVVALSRIEQGNLSNTKSVGSGVTEYRIDSGPGYRIYFGRDGATIVILLAGGTKQRQQADIETAKDRWSDYKQRKKSETV